MRHIKFDILIAVSFLLSACGDSSKTPTPQSSSPRVVNGATVDQAELPQYVKVRAKTGNGATAGCTGTVIGARAVLTAAHCILSGRSLAVQTGEEDGPLFLPEKIFLGHDYDGTSNTHDIAVIITTQEIGRPALPLLGSSRPVAGEEIMIVGFGVEDSDDGEYGTLRHGNMTLLEVSPEYLTVMYDGNGSNVCFGDSGGPAIYFAKDAAGNPVGPAVAGVVSGGTDPACGEGDITYYTSVEQFISAILEVVPDATVR